MIGATQETGGIDPRGARTALPVQNAGEADMVDAVTTRTAGATTSARTSAAPLPQAAPGRRGAEAPAAAGRLMLWSALAGLLAGLLCMTRYSLGVLIVPVVAFIALWGGSRRWKNVVALTGTLAAR